MSARLLQETIALTLLTMASEALGLAQVSMTTNATNLPGSNILLSPCAGSAASGIAAALLQGQPVDVSALIPYSFVLENRDTHRLVAYTLHWTYTRGDGTSSQRYFTYVQIHEFLDGGRPHATKPIPSTFSVAPGVRRVLCPLFNFSPAESRPLSIPARVVSSFVAHHQSDLGLTLSLDSAVLDDGRFYGPDLNLLYNRLQTEISTRQSLYGSILKAADDAEISLILDPLSQQPIPTQPPRASATLEEWQHFFQKLAADPLIAMMARTGGAGVRTLAKQLIYAQPPVLRKQ
jgi:hypothetical protein